MNPLPDDDQKDKRHSSTDEGYTLGRQKENRARPSDNPAADLIRKKVEALFEQEPDAEEEIKEADQAPAHRSKHQRFMHSLSMSGKPLAQIQQEWHSYYERLSNEEKHEVWREFYEAHERHASTYTQAVQGTKAQQAEHKSEEGIASLEKPATQPKPLVSASHHFPEYATQPHHKIPKWQRIKSVERVKHKLTAVIGQRTKTQAKAKQHFKSLLFGLSAGVLAVLILMFSFFNEVVIARLIQPGGQGSSTPIILNADAVAPSDDPELIIPKINVQLPVVYNVPSNQEEVIQQSLDNGIIQYPGTSLPGQKGNAAYFGHSSNNIFNPGKYKFAFALLNDLVPGDIFYITYQGKVYTYSVYDKRIVNPDETWVLGNAPGKLATATLITCDPPGTTLNRLVVWGEQINPDPTQNTNAPTPPSSQPEELPAQGPTLWGRLWNWITGG